MNTITIFKGTSEEKEVTPENVENLCLNYQDLEKSRLDLLDTIEAYEQELQKVRMGL